MSNNTSKSMYKKSKKELGSLEKKIGFIKIDKIKIIKKRIEREIKAIEKDYDSSNWDYVEVDRMESDEAFNRGCYRAYNQVLSWLNSK